MNSLEKVEYGYEVKIHSCLVHSESKQFEDDTDMESPPYLPSNTYYSPPRNDATRSNAPVFNEIPDP